ncbi:MoxR-like ATPase [Salinibacter ruber]|nr:AAA family ATPase [Salinibacter ruber]MCS3823773.1 MoxR-like ATPase [Salinibacter ruber]MCS4184792.1 MoxR-like ATPase [Salinibacter ruber]MCS4189202.1 MoxR-like ATPase [Salinibacter ruber]
MLSSDPPAPMSEHNLAELEDRIATESAFVDDLLDEIGRVVVGQRYMIERLLIGLLADGHVLLEGVPGLAKTLTVRTLSDAIGTDFQRIQFTPDLLPADLLGTQIYNQKTGAFSIKKGPIFTNVILADEINRSPAKVQSALLESMQERQVTIGEETFPLDDLFLVLATQNPIEQEGTYPLPEAQVDRFMLKIDVTYPTGDEELEIMRRMARTDESASVDAVASPEQILQARTVINDLYIDERVEQYIVNLVLASRDPGAYGLGELEPLLEYGASPRASINLNLAARAHAFLRHRAYVTPEDVRAVAQDVMQHRLVITYEAEAEQVAAADLVDRILGSVEVP